MPTDDELRAWAAAHPDMPQAVAVLVLFDRLHLVEAVNTSLQRQLVGLCERVAAQSEALARAADLMPATRTAARRGAELLRAMAVRGLLGSDPELLSDLADLCRFTESWEESMEPQASEVWAVLELMGHVRLAVRVSEEEKFGHKLGRIDVPTPAGGFVTQYFGGQSVYRLTPVSEDVAREVALHTQPRPVHAWELPRQLPPTRPGLDEYDQVEPADHDDPEGGGTDDD